MRRNFSLRQGEKLLHSTATESLFRSSISGKGQAFWVGLYFLLVFVQIVGFKSRASEILNRKRKLSLEMIRQIHSSLNIPTDVLIQTY